MVLRFSDTSSLGFSGDVDLSSSDKLMCYGPLQSETLAEKTNMIFVPGSSEDHSLRLLQEISNQTSSSLSSSFYLPTGIMGDVLRHPHEVRKQYIDSLQSAHKAWISDGKIITKQVTENLIELRKIIRQSSRAQGQVPSFAYKLLDAYRAKKISSGQSYERLFRQGNYPDAIKKVFTPGPATKVTTVFSGVGKVLKKGSSIAMVADISTSAARVYFANTEEDQQKALDALGDDLGATLGVFGGAKICAALTITTGGIGLVGCGIALGAGIYLGGRTGSMLVGGQAANDLVNSIRSSF